MKRNSFHAGYRPGCRRAVYLKPGFTFLREEPFQNQKMDTMGLTSVHSCQRKKYGQSVS